MNLYFFLNVVLSPDITAIFHRAWYGWITYTRFLFRWGGRAYHHFFFYASIQNLHWGRVRRRVILSQQYLHLQVFWCVTVHSWGIAGKGWRNPLIWSSCCLCPCAMLCLTSAWVACTFIFSLIHCLVLHTICFRPLHPALELLAKSVWCGASTRSSMHYWK